MQRPMSLAYNRSASKIMLEKNPDHLQGILSDNEFSPLLSMDVLGRPLIVHNVDKIVSTCAKVDSIFLPTGMSTVADTISEAFPKISITEYTVGESGSRDSEDILKIPTSAVLTKSSRDDVEINQMLYPWDVPRIMERVLETEVRASKISADASVAETTIIDGPCVVEPGVQIDSFCKIKGPLYIGPDAKIGTGSLIRASMIGRESIIGFSCEIGKSYLAERVTIPHLDVILDSVIGQNTWMGAFVGTTNMMLNYKNVMYKLDGDLIDTGLQHFGAIIGHDCTIGAGTIILPGRFVPPGTFIPPNAVFSAVEKQSA